MNLVIAGNFSKRTSETGDSASASSSSLISKTIRNPFKRNKDDDKKGDRKSSVDDNDNNGNSNFGRSSSDGVIKKKHERKSSMGTVEVDEPIKLSISSSSVERRQVLIAVFDEFSLNFLPEMRNV